MKIRAFFLFLFFQAIFSSIPQHILQGISLSFINPDSTHPIISNGVVEKGFIFSTDPQPSDCAIIPTSIEFSDTPTHLIKISSHSSENLTIYLSFHSDKGAFTPTINNSNTLQFNLHSEEKTMNLAYNCKKDRIGWSRVFFLLSITYENQKSNIYGNYIKICSTENIPRFDYSILFLALIAIGIVYIGTRQKLVQLDPNEGQLPELQPIHAIFFILGGSISLVVLFYLITYVETLLTIFFMIVSLSCISILVGESLIEYFGDMFKKKIAVIPFYGEISLSEAVGFVVGVPIIGVYLYTKHWMMNNLIAICIALAIFKIVKITSLKVAALLLCLAFFYDIFWVFYSEIFFGKSVMATVATKVNLPMKLVFPTYFTLPVKRCSLIGLGDLVLPGFFISFVHRFDKFHGIELYHKVVMLGYSFGLFLCLLCLVAFEVSQPALLYLVPGTLCPVAILAKKRNEFEQIWHGKLVKKELKEYTRVTTNLKDEELKGDLDAFIELPETNIN